MAPERAVDTGIPRLPGEPVPKPKPAPRPAVDVPWVGAASTQLSTFGIGGSTGGYAWARAQLRGGTWPEQPVRIEDFGGAFRYDYGAPDDVVGLDIEVAPAPWAGSHLVRIGLQAAKIEHPDRAPLHAVALLHVSPGALPLAQAGLALLREDLDERDALAVRTAGDDLHSALEAAYAAVPERAGAVRRVLLWTEGATDHRLVALGRRYAAEGVSLTVLDVGAGHGDPLLERMAAASDGTYHYLDGVGEAQLLLRDHRLGTTQAVARDLAVQVAWSPGAVVHWRQLGHTTTRRAPGALRDHSGGGTLGSGAQVTVLYEVQLAPGATHLGDVRVTWALPEPGAPHRERAWALELGSVPASFAEASRDLRQAAAATLFAEHLEWASVRPTRSLDLAVLAEIARHTARPEYPEEAELVELIELAERMTPPRRSLTPVVRVEVPEGAAKGVEVQCPSGFRVRAPVEGGVARVFDVPWEECRARLMGGRSVPAFAVTAGTRAVCGGAGEELRCGARVP